MGSYSHLGTINCSETKRTSSLCFDSQRTGSRPGELVPKRHQLFAGLEPLFYHVMLTLGAGGVFKCVLNIFSDHNKGSQSQEKHLQKHDGVCLCNCYA